MRSGSQVYVRRTHEKQWTTGTVLKLGPKNLYKVCELCLHAPPPEILLVVHLSRVFHSLADYLLYRIHILTCSTAFVPNFSKSPFIALSTSICNTIYYLPILFDPFFLSHGFTFRSCAARRSVEATFMHRCTVPDLPLRSPPFAAG